MWNLFFYGGLAVLVLVAIIVAQTQARHFVRRRSELATAHAALSDADLKALLLAEPPRGGRIAQAITYDAACAEAVRRASRNPDFWQTLDDIARRRTGLRSRLAQAYLSQQRSQGL